METKSEKREQKRNNKRKMIVRGRSIFTLQKIMIDKALEAHKKLSLKGTNIWK